MIFHHFSPRFLEKIGHSSRVERVPPLNFKNGHFFQCFFVRNSQYFGFSEKTPLFEKDTKFQSFLTNEKIFSFCLFQATNLGGTALENENSTTHFQGIGSNPRLLSKNGCPILGCNTQWSKASLLLLEKLSLFFKQSHSWLLMWKLKSFHSCKSKMLLLLGIAVAIPCDNSNRYCPCNCKSYCFCNCTCNGY